MEKRDLMKKLRLTTFLTMMMTPLVVVNPGHAAEKDLSKEIVVKERQLKVLESKRQKAEEKRRAAIAIVQIYNPFLEAVGGEPLTIGQFVGIDSSELRERQLRVSRSLHRTKLEQRKRERQDERARRLARELKLKKAKEKEHARRTKAERERLAKARKTASRKTEARDVVSNVQPDVQSSSPRLASTTTVSNSTKRSSAWNCKVPSGDIHTRPWPRRVRTRVDLQFKPNSIGGYRPGDPQDHGKGLALDVMVPVRSAKGDSIARWAINNMDRLNLNYVIWRQRIYGDWDRTWRKMENRGSITANHYDHVHLSFDGSWGTCPTY